MSAKLDERELRIETFSGGPLSPVAVRVTHMPTGIFAKITGASRIKARRAALKELAAKIARVRVDAETQPKEPRNG